MAATNSLDTSKAITEGREFGRDKKWDRFGRTGPRALQRGVRFV